jgi:hypothetical protein
VLRITVLFLHDRTKVVLTGQLVAGWAEYLPKAITQCCPPGETVDIDLDGITCADLAGEQALLSLQQDHRHFLGTSPLPKASVDHLGIPIEGNS